MHWLAEPSHQHRDAKEAARMALQALAVPKSWESNQAKLPPGSGESTRFVTKGRSHSRCLSWLDEERERELLKSISFSQRGLGRSRALWDVNVYSYSLATFPPLSRCHVLLAHPGAS